MHRLFYLFVLVSVLFHTTAYSQKIELLNEGTKTSIRGLSVVNDRIVWVSGSNGHVGKSIDGGKTWKWTVVKGFEKRDFRDIEAFDESTAIIIAIAEPANILKTVDGGETWKVVYENKTAGMFLDAMEFWNKQNGIVIGDPIKGKLFMARTVNEGESWWALSDNESPAADSGEAFFAASGTNIRTLAGDKTAFVSGGLRSRLFWKDKIMNLPLIQGKETTGANSIAVRDKKGKHLIVVGGDFGADSSAEKNCFLSSNGGKTWTAPTIPPHGYRSCVEYINKKKLIACGTSGVDVSANGGKEWQLITKQGFHVCRKAKDGNTVFLAGGNGRIARLVW